MRILAIFTRNPYTRPTGRKAVLKTIVDALTSLGHELDLVVYDADRSGVPENLRVFWRSPLGLGRTIGNVIFRSFFGPLSLNESAYYKAGERSYLRDLAGTHHYDLVIADMLRTASLAEATGRPLLIDMDDLLSVRYEGYLRGDGGIDGLLGYYGERLPPWFSRVLLMFAKPALAWEARRLRNRELYWVERAEAVSLVSDLEAKKLSRRAGKRVLSLPMAVEFQERVWSPGATFVHDVAYVGGMDYQPNVEAVEWYQTEVALHMSARLDVIGVCPESTKTRLTSDRIRFVGFVDDLYEELRRCRVFAVPIVSGSGIRTKVLEAVAVGVPVVATSHSLAGIGLVHGEHCVVADSGKQFAEALKNVLGAPEEARARAARARRFLAGNYSSAAIEAKWAEAIRHVLENVDQA